MNDLLERFDELGPEDIRCPPHPLPIARARIESGAVCEPERHEWIDLDGHYWRECRTCGLADVTVADLGQPVETPHVSRVER